MGSQEPVTSGWGGTSKDEAASGGAALPEGQVLSEDQRRRVEAAIARLGLNKKTAATAYELSYDNVRKILAGQEKCWPKYADAFQQIIIDARLSDEL